ncbi:effector-associated constant component EACC1 [Paractinoplanes hotanensis]|uniref:Uncharacterized protein n=1 Tax=Paractinoplanes hotanensis TaxID=2906497 RepID=A0ABT0XUL7_9ACTN|nr:hypothetical protein [Actinoplanes hotanensis]MCM4077481.1 hypothetical protein [Actinoplanes hotanensis]
MKMITTEILVRFPAADAENLSDLTRTLQKIILDESDVDDVRPATTGTAPAGSKSGEVVAVGALVVTLAPIVLEGLVTVLSSWLSRQPSDVEIEVDGHRFKGRVTKAQRDALVTAFVRRVESE